MLVKHDEIRLIYNDGKIINNRISVKISNKTALIFVDGNNVFSLYPKNLNVDETAEIIKEYCNDNDYEFNTEEYKAVAKWIKERL